MPIQAPQWTEFLNCPVCGNEFNGKVRVPITLGCGHTLCRTCLTSLQRKQCPFDQNPIRLDFIKLPPNTALLQLVGVQATELEVDPTILPACHVHVYRKCVKCIEELSLYLPQYSTGAVSFLSRPMQRKLVALANCQILEVEGRSRAVRGARSLGERTVTELLLLHQNPQQLSANLWAAVRARGCQFLGPAMQEEVLKLVLLALEDGSALSRKVLVMFVVQRLEPHYTQASKTSIGHVVQLLYRASCFKVSKREGDSSLMQLKEEFRNYEALRREHDAQIVQIATEAGLRIAPDQWSSLLYGDTAHKSHMQSIMDKLQTPQSFCQSVQELLMALQRSGDPGGLAPLRTHFDYLALVDANPEATPPPWEQIASGLEAARAVVAGLAEFILTHGGRRIPEPPVNSRYKVSMCRDLGVRGACPRGPNCTYAHSEVELERFRSRARKTMENVAVRNAGYEPPVNSFSLYSSTTTAVAFTSGYLWYLEKDRLYTRNANALLLAASNGDHIETADIPCNEAILNKHEVQNLAYENNMCEPLNMNLVTPTWSPQVPVSDSDHHFYLQSPLTIDSQRMKHQLRNLENKMMDIRLNRNEESAQLQMEKPSHFEDSLQEEELYEAGIAEDMRVLEERWDCELAEQERRWSESDPKAN